MDLRIIGFHPTNRIMVLSPFGGEIWCETVEDAVDLIRELIRSTTTREQVYEGFKKCGLIERDKHAPMFVEPGRSTAMLTCRKLQGEVK